MDELIQIAYKQGFSKALIIKTDKLVFSPEFREYCRENLCGQYGKNYSCPQDCGDFDVMRERVMRYKNVLVLQSSWEIDDFSKKDVLDRAKHSHNESTLRMMEHLRKAGYDCLMAGASACSLCNLCAKLSGEKCRHPDICFSCLSAYCINVKLLADECSMSYQYKDGILSFFSACFFDDMN